MDQVNSDIETLCAVPLDQLCSGAHHEMLMLGYSRRTLNRYLLVWQHFAEFAIEQHLRNKYSRRLAIHFEEIYGLRKSSQLKPEERWSRHLIFAMKVLDDYAQNGNIVRFVVEKSGLSIPPTMQKTMHDYERYAKEQRHLRMSSIQERMHSIAVFLDFLRSRDVMTLEQMKADDVSAFITTRSRWKARTVSHVTSNLKQFLRFLFLHNILSHDFSTMFPTVRTVRHDTIPSVWDQELVVKLLDAVDRKSPKGKRDYAILLLAARLGMRTGDIRALRLDDINWTAAKIEIVQAKTGSPLILPMSEEIGLALIDYLKSARPSSPHREVFLNLTPPFEPFSENNHLYHIVLHWRELAGIRFRSKQHQGLRSLRHTLATRLLQQGTPFHVISSVLGHALPATTFIYAKADVEMLRIAALNTEEVCHVK
jgi:integrase